MPMYEYFCPDCTTHHEVIQKVSSDSSVSCPSCGSANMTRKFPSSFGMQFQGSGFYKTDYCTSKDTKPSEGHCHTSSCGCTS